MSRRLKVLIVDDSAFMRGVIARMLGSDARFEVVGQAEDGPTALRLTQEREPDVISMDFNMPGMNGAETTRRILALRPTPIIMLSAHTREGEAATVEALAAGAIDFVTKPGGEVSAHLSSIRDELTSKLVSAAKANLGSAEPARATPTEAQPPTSLRTPRKVPSGLRLVVIAASTGGPAALNRLIPSLRLGSRAALVIIQHMPAGYTGALADQLRDRSGYVIKEAAADETLQPGVGLVAPGNFHLVVERGARVALKDTAPVHGVRPAADVTLASAAQHFGARCVGVVLTGMGRDGARGLAAVKAAGGATLAQDRNSSMVYGMPKAAVELGVVETVAPLDRMADVINKLITGDA